MKDTTTRESGSTQTAARVVQTAICRGSSIASQAQTIQNNTKLPESGVGAKQPVAQDRLPPQRQTLTRAPHCPNKNYDVARLLAQEKNQSTALLGLPVPSLNVKLTLRPTVSQSIRRSTLCCCCSVSVASFRQSRNTLCCSSRTAETSWGHIKQRKTNGWERFTLLRRKTARVQCFTHVTSSRSKNSWRAFTDGLFPKK